MKIPERFSWATTLVHVKPDEAILEIGCGAGIFAQCIAEKITTGKLVAIDKSKPMLEKARKRNKHLIANKKIEFIHSEFKKFEGKKAFGKVVSFNVNFYWKNSAEDFAALHNSLTRTGFVFAFFEIPFHQTASSFAKHVSEIFNQHNFAVHKLKHSEFNSRACVCLICRPDKMV